MPPTTTTTTPASPSTSSAFSLEKNTTLANTDDLITTSNENNPKRRNLGRKARRRRKKAAEIQLVANATVTVTANVLERNQDTCHLQQQQQQQQQQNSLPLSNIPTILPTDREYKWKSVKELCTLTPQDEQDILQQLGYLPGNAISVAARVKDIFPKHTDNNKSPITTTCSMFWDDNSPLVLRLYPLVLRDETDGTKSKRKRKRQKEPNNPSNVTDNDNSKNDVTSTTTTTNNNNMTDNTSTPLVEPFPTILWVTHPHFKALISQLELKQLGIQFEQQLQQDTQAMDSMKQAHIQYGQERKNLLTVADQEWIQNRGWESALEPARGVAGIRNYASVKCLHAHAAHYWSGCPENIVGKWVAQHVMQVLLGDTSHSEC